MTKTGRLDEAFRELADSYELVQNAATAKDLLTACKALRADTMWIENILRAELRTQTATRVRKTRRSRKRLSPESHKHKRRISASTQKSTKALPPGKKS